jgi:hypothetical protein
LESFDVASADTPTAQRSITTVAPQALILLNSDFLNQQAATLAARVADRQIASPTEVVNAAYELAIGRQPTARERGLAVAFLERERQRWGKTPNLPAAAPETSEQLIGWRQFGGQWSRREDGGCQVKQHPGAKIVREGLSFADGTIEAQIMLEEGSGDAGLLVRATEPTDGVNAVHAYNINLRHNSLRLGKHESDWRSLASVKADIALGTWHNVRAELNGGRIRVWLDGAEKPLIDYTDAAPLASGSSGFRTFQVDAAVRQIRVRRGDVVEDISMEYSRPVPASASVTGDRALAELCKLILNLNEFIYVD